MNWRIATALLLALALAPSVQASHFQAYANYPDGHDDLGSSNEPDFRGTTGLLGVPVNERVVDFTLDGRGEPSASIAPGKVLAPGCTDDAGRQPNGLCGLYTIGAENAEGTESGLGFPPRTVGIEGMSGPNAPGLTGSKATVVRLMDQKAVTDQALPLTGTNFIDHNKKLTDTGAFAAMKTLDPNFGQDVLLYSMAHFVWYGKWQDRNGNGVLDHLQAGIDPLTGNPLENAANEFQFYGNCKAFDGSTNVGWHCFQESASAPGGTVEMASYIYPGHHHAYCGAAPGGASNLCDKVGIDMPGANLLCLGDMLGQGAVATSVGRCFTATPEAIEQNEQQFEGDPLFGVQNGVNPDQTYDDRSGDQGFDTRGWYFGLGWPTFYYDQSAVTTTTLITVVNCNDTTDERAYDLASCAFVDVDQYPSWNPALEQVLAGTVKPTARSNYVMLRDTAGPLGLGVDGQLNNRRTDLSQVTGPVNDQVQNPGWSREPNTVGDVFPAAVRGVCTGADAGDRTHNGWCNTYTGYRAAGGRGWADIQILRSVTYDRATGTPVNSCTSGVPLFGCVSGPGTSLDDSPENQRADGDHSRSLGPGGYFFAGASGRWQDRTQVWHENYLDLDPTSPTFGTVQDRQFTAGPDGWVGNVVNATGAFYYRGYTDESCTTEAGVGLKTYAACHPYLDGAISDPQQAGGVLHGEWTGNSCDATSNPGRELQMIPSGGVWTVPVFVVENHAFIHIPNSVTTGQVVDYTGTSGPITLGINCFESGGFLSNDFVVLPQGNFGLDVTTRLVQRIPQAPPSTGFDIVIDVDQYVKYA